MTKMSTPSHDELLRYLQAAKETWRIAEDRDRAVIWEHVTGQRLFSPKNSTPDAERLVRLAIADIARGEERNAADVTLDLQVGSLDRLEGTKETSADNTLPIDVAIAMQDGMRRSIEVTRTMMDGGTPGRRLPGSVADYMENVRVLPHEQGSFIVRVLFPVDQQVELLPDRDASTPARLMKISTVAVQAANESLASPSEEIWNHAAEQGVTPQLCSALSDLSQAPDLHARSELRVEWTWAEPKPSPQIASKVTIPAALSSPLKGGAEVLAAKSETGEFTMLGQVVTLHRESKSGHGAVTVRGQVDQRSGELRPWRIELAESDYERAIDAHKERQLVRVIADVTDTPGKQMSVNHVTSFTPMATAEYPEQKL